MRDFLTFEGHMKQAGRALGRGDQSPPGLYEVPAYYKGIPSTVAGPVPTWRSRNIVRSSTSSSSSAWSLDAAGRISPRATQGRYIAGYTIWNDFSARDQQMREAPVGMGPSKGKDFDSGNAVGPYLVTADELDVKQPPNVARVNGETWTDSSSAGRQFSFEDLIVHVSQSETIHAGELWGSGTVTSGSGLELGKWLQPDDVVELEIEGIGKLENRVVGRARLTRKDDDVL